MIIDDLFMEFVHSLCVYAGFVFTPLLRLVSFLGEKAWIFLLIAFLLLLSKKTRWIGLTIIISILIGFIFGNMIIKPFIARLRPYEASNKFLGYWELAGKIEETNFSMPSGHTIGCASFFISLYLCVKKSWKKNILICGIFMISLMIISRTYFMHHYLTDCLAGILIAIIVSFISKFIVKLFYRFCKSFEDIGIFSFILNFDFYNRKK